MPSLLSQTSKALHSDRLSGKPETAVTSWIERACDPRIDDSQVLGIIPELVAVINLQPTGPTEASRAIRKKLKYGDVERQTRAIVMLESLVLNCGERFQTTFANERLVERISIMTQDPHTDIIVKKRIMIMLNYWAKSFSDDPRMSLVAGLYTSCGGGHAKAAREAQEAYRTEQERLENLEKARRERIATVKSQKVEAKMREKAEREKKEQEKKMKKAGQQQQVAPRQFILEQEIPLILQAVATASQCANNLVNSLQHVNREDASVIMDIKVQDYLAKTKEARKKVVRYTQLVPDQDTDGEYLGTLISANEQVMAALQLYDRMSKPVELDSDDEEVARLTAAGKSRSSILGTSRVTSSEEADDAITTRLQAASMYDSREGEVDKLQHAQMRAVIRHNSGYGHDLAGLDFGANAPGLPAPIRPQGHGDVRSSSVDAFGTLSDYSDHDSSDGGYSPVRASGAPASTSSTAASSFTSGTHDHRHNQRQGSSGTKPYQQHLNEFEKRGDLGKGLLSTADADDEDNGVDPFADPDDVVTPGIYGKRAEWAEV